MYATPTGVDQNFQPVTFAQMLAANHVAYIKAQLTAPDGTPVASGLTVTAGGVTVDRSAQVRRSVQFSIAAETPLGSFTPASSSDALAPYGNRLRLWYGIDVPGAAASNPYYWPLGVFRLGEVSVSDDGAPTISGTAYDLSRTIARNKLTVPWVVASGTNAGDAIIALASDRLPGLEYRAHSVTAVLPTTVIDPEQDPWQTITDWATSFGSEVYFDTDGFLTISAEPDPTMSPVVWTYQDSGDGRNAVLLSVDRSMSDEPGYNGVIATAESTTIPVPLRSEVWDLNPSSPTYSLGPYGKVPKFVTNPYAATQAQLDAAANAELLRSIGGTEQLSASVVPNPAHEAGDVIRVIRPRSKTDQTTVLESFTFPLDVSDAMGLTCRERRSLS